MDWGYQMNLDVLTKLIQPIVSTLTKAKRADPRRLKPGELLQVLNSTPMGPVLTDHRLRMFRAKAAMRIGDGKSIDLFRFIGWLANCRHSQTPVTPQPTIAKSKPPKVKDKEKPPPLILRTIPAVAKHYKVSITTVNQWLIIEGFPGRVGDGGKKNGYFPVAEIDAWLLKREADRETGPSSKAARKVAQANGMAAVQTNSRRDRKLDIENQRSELKFNREMGLYVLKSDAVQVFQRHHAIAKQIFLPIPDILMGSLPVDLPEEIKTDAYKTLQDIIRNVCETFADALNDELFQ